MKNIAHFKRIGVYGNQWAESTKKFIEVIGLAEGRVSLFKYDCRESLFQDQYDIFIITDFRKNTEEPWSSEELSLLEEMRQVIYTRSMKCLIMANIDDVNVAKALREASASVIPVQTKGRPVPNAFAEALLDHYFGSIEPQEKVLCRVA
jgi:hypothetical protein